ncbi:MAG: tRNA-dihydrouridine synthase [Spirochaetota bacterium]
MKPFYLAPLQGLTDTVFRTVITRHYPVITKTFTPFFSADNPNMAKEKNYTRLLSDGPLHLVPQLLSKDGARLARLVDLFENLGFNECNLNLGCPFPTVTGKGRGSALLQYPATIDRILDTYYSRSRTALSLKVRLGFRDPDEIFECVSVLNRYPLRELIVHPRTAHQKYEGQLDNDRFARLSGMTHHPLVYNGEITSCARYRTCIDTFPDISAVMIGRGVLYNLLLPEEIVRGGDIPLSEKMKREKEIFSELFDSYGRILCGEAQFLQKMKNLCSYLILPAPSYKRKYKMLFKTHSKDVFYSTALELIDEKNLSDSSS